MSAQHTPGPWDLRWNDQDGLEPAHMITQSNTNDWPVPVAYVYGEEDARLIAAAPDLLEALQNYVTTIATAGGGDRALFMAAIREADNKARAAVAKATGSTA